MSLRFVLHVNFSNPNFLLCLATMKISPLIEYQNTDIQPLSKQFLYSKQSERARVHLPQHLPASFSLFQLCHGSCTLRSQSKLATGNNPCSKSVGRGGHAETDRFSGRSGTYRFKRGEDCTSSKQGTLQWIAIREFGCCYELGVWAQNGDLYSELLLCSLEYG